MALSRGCAVAPTNAQAVHCAILLRLVSSIIHDKRPRDSSTVSKQSPVKSTDRRSPRRELQRAAKRSQNSRSDQSVLSAYRDISSWCDQLSLLYKCADKKLLFVPSFTRRGSRNSNIQLVCLHVDSRLSGFIHRRAKRRSMLRKCQRARVWLLGCVYPESVPSCRGKGCRRP